MKNSICLLFVFFIVKQYSIAQYDSISTESLLFNDEKIFNIVENMPSWKGCENLKTEEKRNTCTMEEVKAFISENLVYPEKSRQEKVEGTVYVTFVIDDTGNVINPKILRGINEELDSAALEVVNSMPTWNPGKQRGKVVAVQYNLPIKFKLSNSSKK